MSRLYNGEKEKGRSTMSNKSIVFTAPCVSEILEIETPELKEDEVLIKLVRSAISAGTERANITGDPNTSIYTKELSYSFPRHGGYSSAGIVEAVGNKVSSVKPGDRVAMSWTMHDERYVKAERFVYKLPDNVSFGAGALVHIATFPAAAIRKCRLEFGESALVMGFGVLGIIALKLLRVAGASPIIVADPVKEKRELAMKLGADYALNPLDEGFAQKVKEITGGGASVAIEVTGIGAGLDGALDCMKKFGRVALLGCTRNSDFSIDYYRKVHGPGITLIGAHTLARPEKESYGGWWSERDEALAIINLISTGRLNFDELIEEVNSPLEHKEIYKRLISEKSFPIIEFDWSDT